jgi:hypothetical protein
VPHHTKALPYSEDCDLVGYLALGTAVLAAGRRSRSRR